MRPVASAGTRARTRAFSNSMSLGLIEAIVGWALDADRLIVQKSSKPANVLSTVISRVSTASRPARVHNSSPLVYEELDAAFVIKDSA